ncbi:hypothetical protein G8T76_10655 [Clostridium botulinum C/D]|uniref:hypothetical protein n=1 Tax=Clostridium botulinum TaxID=1491 RepID=UPI00030169CB|nr:hypothetical protein [Clostridium botulinum]KEI02893.1 hypothetical protein Y848_06425 [Clostridium botulinum C/D str. Sp77]KOA76865.1 hypothetical protein ADU78_05250 [Clostridium botulinum]KOA80944.1 hypothetical protein ADU77_00175 [Clostridium botulinum]KOA88970.1 hypothetical protein ADU75_00905 [Clostridium botulinum]KOC31839.1 hypothetical protein ADU83_11975 [Clostridium botulinum]
MENCNIVICDRCKKEITLKKEELKQKKINDIIIKYFECDRCNKKYIYIIVDDFTKSKQNKIYKLQTKLKNELEKQRTDFKKIDKYNENIRKIMRDILEYQKRIRVQFENF